ncbi:Predicted nucleotide-binding protein, sugar kinase/HSP70/actin superfamily [Anaerobranca californiensis DSM 14826]|jgi:predicted nucleotide-binding protein (sugar kinase/HSP70/actin superfamily)|uniref:Predicted nucleotide-binding protein, sugar kinase/HSP70/actin superfamily n=1 Tax=Anaerobranca californiensis DSM 14826 TaxID=1120989 RepID=A0A1M6L2A5_9FIRM|nr:acyl-CoA dehydratase activase-related protein [Anaerobranca californiensis]SHJ65317.1 Predicted nucleotide-binding protein, sugar kinase/HSP70/actin superfamily [Anaerobranca californiensis DSM 14826]
MNKFTIGIPRALLFYDFMPYVDYFFKNLGLEIVLSPPTNKKIIEKGNELSVDEACLPVKVCMGHLQYFEEQKVNLVFLPRVISIEKGKYICPKFLGLPDYAKSYFGNKLNFFSPDIKVNGFNNFRKSLKDLSKNLPVNKGQINHALKEVRNFYLSNEKLLKEGKNLKEIITNAKLRKKDFTIALIGHGYNIYDGGISLDIFDKVIKRANVKTVEMYSEEELNLGKQFLPKPLFWSFGERILAAALYSLKYKDVDGMVLVTAFGCGPDSFVNELIQQFHKKHPEIPLMILTLDEHSAEAGLVTRLEAFMDLLSLRRKRLWA